MPAEPRPTDDEARAAGRSGADRRELARAAAVCALVVLVWLARAFAALGSAVLAPSDVGQDFSLTRVDGAGPATNGALSDVTVQMHAWSEFARHELSAGRVPLWNPFNGGGEPFLANYQSAVFSPFHLPFFACEFPLALVLQAFLVLWVLAFAGYAFARELRASPLGAAAGSAVLTFAAHNVLLLQYPHAAVAACAVATLALAARWLSAAEARAFAEPASRVRARVLARPGLFAAFVVALAAEALAGQPEVLCFGACALALFVSGRTFATARPARARVAIAAWQLGAGALLAAGLTAFQWLPFLEYARNSALAVARDSEAALLDRATWPQLFFPDLLGAPRALLPNAPILSFYEPTNVVHTSALALLAAALALVLAWRRPFVRGCALLTGAWFAVAYDVAGIGRLVSALPLAGDVPFNRGQLVAALGVAVLAALAVTELEERAERGAHGRAALVTCCVAALSLAVFVAGASAYAAARTHAAGLETPVWNTQHVVFVALTFGLGAAALAGLVLARAAALRKVCGAAFVSFVLAQSAWVFRAYLPLSDARTLFARNAALVELESALARVPGGGTVAVLGNDVFPPELNAAHRVRQISAYDALWVRDYDELYQRAFGRVNNWRSLRRASEADLEAFGVDLVLASGTETPFTTNYALARGPLVAPPHVIGADGGVAQTFVAGAERLRRVGFVVVDPGAGAVCGVSATLAWADGGAPLAERTWSASELTFNARRRCNLALECAALDGSATRALRLVIRRDPACAQGSIAVQARAYAGDEPANERARRELRVNGAETAAELQLALACEPAVYRPSGKVGAFDAFARRGGPARYRVVAADAESHVPPPPPKLELVAQDGALFPRFADAPGSSVRVVADEPGRVRLAAHLPPDTRLVTALAAYPGWRARVDGVERGLEPWLGAFLALAPDASDDGREREIELVYAPATFRAGLAGAALCAVLALAWIVASGRARA